MSDFVCPHCHKTNYYHESWCRVWKDNPVNVYNETHDEDELKKLRKQVDDLKKEVVFGFYEDEHAIYVQGYEKGLHELTSPLTASEANHMIKTIISLRTEITGLKANLRYLSKLVEEKTKEKE